MTSPSDAFNKAIAGVNDFLTSKKKKAALTYQDPRPNPAPARVDTTNQNKLWPSLRGMKPGSVVGAPQTSQSKALQAKLK